VPNTAVALVPSSEDWQAYGVDTTTHTMTWVRTLAPASVPSFVRAGEELVILTIVPQPPPPPPPIVPGPPPFLPYVVNYAVRASELPALVEADLDACVSLTPDF
jgi:hypothetical protein